MAQVDRPGTPAFLGKSAPCLRISSTSRGGTSSGGGASGIGHWWFMPSPASAKEKVATVIGSPACSARICRTENERVSRSRSTE